MFTSLLIQACKLFIVLSPERRKAIVVKVIVVVFETVIVHFEAIKNSNFVAGLQFLNEKAQKTISILFHLFIFWVEGA